jgi:hypothetical protein
MKKKTAPAMAETATRPQTTPTAMPTVLDPEPEAELLFVGDGVAVTVTPARPVKTNSIDNGLEIHTCVSREGDGRSRLRNGGRRRCGGGAGGHIRLCTYIDLLAGVVDSICV